MNIRAIVKRIMPVSVFRMIEPYGHLAEAIIQNIIHGFPARGMKVIGITGTNGKTTTSFLVYQMLKDAGYDVGLMTTVAYGVNEDIHPQMHHMTTVPVGELMRRLVQMRRKGIDWLVLETTSHALAQYRVWGVPYSVAVMTNVTHEHLDYHRTFERYRSAKVRLFKLAALNQRGLRTGIVNAEDPSWRYFARAVPHAISYGIKQGDVRAKTIHLTPNGSDYLAEFEKRRIKIHTNLPGSFNISNTLSAVSVGIVVGLSDEQIIRGIAAVKNVEGRMTTVDEGQGFNVIIDYAHTPDSFEKLFKDMRPVVKGKLIVMFGSAGRRDETKRAVQGKLAGTYADEVILTEEDDRDADGMQIIEQIAAGATTAGKKRGEDLFLVHDRVVAIRYTLSRAKAGDTVLLLGKGHEKTIERASGEEAWDELGETKRALRSFVKLRQ